MLLAALLTFLDSDLTYFFALENTFLLVTDELKGIFAIYFVQDFLVFNRTDLKA